MGRVVEEGWGMRRMEVRCVQKEEREVRVSEMGWIMVGTSDNVGIRA